MNDNFKTYLQNIIETIHQHKPLVHHITNYVTVNDCANITLAIGASPVMADDIAEVEEMVAIASSLVINIGTLNQRTIESMMTAGKAANQKGIPVILDPVGAGATRLRTETAARLIQEVQFAVIRGNVSEIKTIYGVEGGTRGVDAAAGDGIHTVRDTIDFATNMARKLKSVIAITGAIDIIADGNQSCVIQNGHPMMAAITGTGCMCTSLVGSFCGASGDHFAATAAAVMTMGLAGEKAFERLEKLDLGNGSYRSFILDEISRMNGQKLMNGGKICFE